MNRLDPWDESEQPPMGHSPFGIASFVIFLVVDAFYLSLFLIAGVLENANPGALEETHLGEILGVAFIGTLMLNLVGIGLGIAGLFIGNKRKLFAILGVCLGAAVFMGALALIAIGLFISDQFG